MIDIFAGQSPNFCDSITNLALIFSAEHPNLSSSGSFWWSFNFVDKVSKLASWKPFLSCNILNVRWFSSNYIPADKLMPPQLRVLVYNPVSQFDIGIVNPKHWSYVHQFCKHKSWINPMKSPFPIVFLGFLWNPASGPSRPPAAAAVVTQEFHDVCIR